MKLDGTAAPDEEEERGTAARFIGRSVLACEAMYEIQKLREKKKKLPLGYKADSGVDGSHLGTPRRGTYLGRAARTGSDFRPSIMGKGDYHYRDHQPPALSLPQVQMADVLSVPTYRVTWQQSSRPTRRGSCEAEPVLRGARTARSFCPDKAGATNAASMQKLVWLGID